MCGTLATEFQKKVPDYLEKLDVAGNARLLDWDICARGLVSEADVLKVYADVTGLDVINEDELPVTPVMREEIPLDFLTYQACVPCDDPVDGVLILAVSDPYSIDHLRYTFKKLHSLDVVFKLSRRGWIDRTIQALYMEDENENDGEFDNSDFESEETLLSLASEAKIVRLVNEMFARAVEMDASDIHIEPDENQFAIRFRIDGKLYESMTPPLSLYPAIASRIKLVGGLNIAERRLPQDGRTDMQVGGTSIDVRISTIPTMNGESIVLRILKKDSVELDFKSIGMNADTIAVFEKLIKRPHGMLLVVGPTGSGKSTTLHTLITKINTQDRKIITIEDPVEYRTEGIQQIQVNSKIGLDFASGLRHIVRQDPDVILVGEIRDRETAEIAIHAALTGHLVLSTLHTNDAPSAVTRLVDMGIESFLVSSSIIGVLSQRLVRRLCDDCDQGIDPITQNKCKSCNGRGFKGRIGIFELMELDDEIRDLVASGADAAQLAVVAQKNGMRPLVEDGKDKVKLGVTTMAEVVGITSDVNI
jgi:type II secretory ATPase GspE/PulE/Tfp pilus assembly ATPase PilB-like protein